MARPCSRARLSAAAAGAGLAVSRRASRRAANHGTSTASAAGMRRLRLVLPLLAPGGDVDVYLGALMTLQKLACSTAYFCVLDEVLALAGTALLRVVRDGLQSQHTFVPLAALGIDRAGFVFHSFRAGGALRLLNGGVELGEILRRGRWRRPESARPYLQRLRALCAAEQIPAALLNRGALLAANPPPLVRLVTRGVPGSSFFGALWAASPPRLLRP